MKERNIRDKSISCLFLPAISILFVNYITRYSISSAPPTFVDELGYLGNAAALAGYEWKTAFVNIPYYAFGYSTLFVPLYIITNDISIIYCIAKIINILLLLLSFYCLREILADIFKLDDLIYSLAAFIATISPCFLVMKNYALPEVTIYVVFLFIIRFLQKYKTSFLIRWKILCILFSILLLYLHMRTIGVLVATVFCIAIFDIKNEKVRIRDIVLLVMILILGLLGLSIIKDYISGILGTGTVNANNSITGQISRVEKIISINGFVELFQSIVAKCWAVVCGSYGTIIFGAIYLFKRIKEKNTNDWIIPVFLFLSLVSEIFISAVYMSEISDRIDMVFYTRYCYFAVAPFVGIGVAILGSKYLEKRYYLFSMIIILILLKMLLNQISTVKMPTRIIPFSISELMIWWNPVNKSINYLLASTVCLALILLYSFANRYISTMVCCALATLSIYSAKISLNPDLYTNPWIKYDYKSEVDYIESNFQDTSIISGDDWESNYLSAWIQIQCPETNISIRNVKQIKNEGIYMIEKAMIPKMEKDLNYAIVYETDEYIFLEL